MGKVIRPFCWHQNFVPCPGVHVLNHENNCIKSNFKEISLKLATNGKSDKAFLLTPKFSPLGSLCRCAGATCIKSWIKMYKIRLQRHFLNLQQMNEMTRHIYWHQNFVPWGLSAPANENLLYKIRLQKVFLKLATYNWSDKRFLLTSKFFPQGVVSPCPGAIYMYKIMKEMYTIIQRVFFFFFFF